MAKATQDMRVWPRPQEMKLAGKGPSLAAGFALAASGRASWLDCEIVRVADVLNNAAGKRIIKPAGAPLTLMSMDALPREFKSVRKPEGSVLLITAREIILAGGDARGLYYGAQTLARLIENAVADKQPRLPGAVIRDWPRFPMRG